MVLLTATPHSGDEDAFYRLLGLLDAQLRGRARPRRTRPHRGARAAGTPFRAAPAPGHRRVDGRAHLPAARGHGAHVPAHGSVGEVLRAGPGLLCRRHGAASGDDRRQRLTFWGTLALMRCVSSSRPRRHRRCGRAWASDPKPMRRWPSACSTAARKTCPRTTSSPAPPPATPVLERLVARPRPSRESWRPEAGAAARARRPRWSRTASRPSSSAATSPPRTT